MPVTVTPGVELAADRLIFVEAVPTVGAETPVVGFWKTALAVVEELRGVAGLKARSLQGFHDVILGVDSLGDAVDNRDYRPVVPAGRRAAGGDEFANTVD